MVTNRRRRHLGAQKSAAIVQIWEELERRGWTDAQLAQAIEEDTATVARLVYGDRKANRTQATSLLEVLGTPLKAWDEPCGAKQRRHRTAATVFSDRAATERKSA